MAVLQNVLTPSVVTGIVSRIYTPGSPLQNYFGMEIGGRNVEQVLGRAYSYDIFDNLRTIAKFRQPGTGPSTNAVNPVGRQPMTFARTYEKWQLNYELLNNIRAIGQNAGQRDREGVSYLENQARQLKLKFVNVREFLIGSLLTKGKASIKFSGDDMLPVQSLGGSPGMTIDWKIPSGNIGLTGGAFAANLNPLGTGNIIDAAWSNNASDVATQLDKINQAFQILIGAPLSLAITDSTGWRYLTKNSSLQAQGGSVNAVFAEYQMEDLRGPDGNKIGIFKGRLRAVPWLDWLIVDTALDYDDGDGPVRWFPGNTATFMIDPSAYWLKMVEGSELVKDNPMSPAVQRYGFWSWLREWDEPARVELHAIMNMILQLSIPKALMIGQIA